MYTVRYKPHPKQRSLAPINNVSSFQSFCKSTSGCCIYKQDKFIVSYNLHSILHQLKLHVYITCYYELKLHNTIYLVRYLLKISRSYLSQFLEHIIPLMFHQVGDHGSTLSSIELILLRDVLMRRAVDAIACLCTQSWQFTIQVMYRTLYRSRSRMHTVI